MATLSGTLPAAGHRAPLGSCSRALASLATLCAFDKSIWLSGPAFAATLDRVPEDAVASVVYSCDFSVEGVTDLVARPLKPKEFICNAVGEELFLIW